MRTTSIPLLTEQARARRSAPVRCRCRTPAPTARRCRATRRSPLLHHAFDPGLAPRRHRRHLRPRRPQRRAQRAHRRRGRAHLVGRARRSSSSSPRSASRVRRARTASEWGRDGSRDYLLRAAEASVGRARVRARRDHQPPRQPRAAAVRRDRARHARRPRRRVRTGDRHRQHATSPRPRPRGRSAEGTIAAVENERSPRYRGDSDVFDWAIAHDVAFFPWSPFGGGADAKNLPTALPRVRRRRGRARRSRPAPR